MPDFRSALKLNSLPIKNFAGSGDAFNIYRSTNTVLQSFAAETDVPGTSMSIVVSGSNSTVLAIANFSCVVTVGATMTGFLNWNGSDRTPEATLTCDTGADVVSVSQSWLITGVTAATYTAKLRASCSVNSASNELFAGSTFLNILVLGNS